jgi:hypothetical protein
VEQACSPAAFRGGEGREAPGLALPEALASLPALTIRADYAARLSHGGQPGPEDIPEDAILPEPGAWVRMLAPSGELLALGRMEEGDPPVLRLRRRLAAEEG